MARRCGERAGTRRRRPPALRSDRPASARNPRPPTSDVGPVHTAVGRRPRVASGHEPRRAPAVSRVAEGRRSLRPSSPMMGLVVFQSCPPSVVSTAGDLDPASTASTSSRGENAAPVTRRLPPTRGRVDRADVYRRTQRVPRRDRFGAGRRADRPASPATPAPLSRPGRASAAVNRSTCRTASGRHAAPPCRSRGLVAAGPADAGSTPSRARTPRRP